jgi:hypothetical protein
MEKYDKDYFENGVEKHVSGYTDYRWRPEYVLPLATWLRNKFGDCLYLDYGCAKGFLVKALRLLNQEAYGYDISEYAIQNCEPEVREYISNCWMDRYFTVIVAKDVLEHVDKKRLPVLLKGMSFSTRYVVAIIPLGDDGKFRIREYEMDITHITKEDEVWWIKQFNDAGFVCEEFYYNIPGIKDNWTAQYPYGNGIFILRKK